MTVPLLWSSHLPWRSQLGGVCREGSCCHSTLPVAPERLPSTGPAARLTPQSCILQKDTQSLLLWSMAFSCPHFRRNSYFISFIPQYVSQALLVILEWNHRIWTRGQEGFKHLCPCILLPPTSPALWAWGRACRPRGSPGSVPDSLLISCYLLLAVQSTPILWILWLEKKTTLLSWSVFIPKKKLYKHHEM